MKIELQEESATRIFAQDLALCLQKGDMLTLSGDLGAGKSTLARALIRALADNDRLEVPSPSFALLQIYEETRLPLAHADIYRIEAAAEIEELGFADLLAAGIVLIEWPEKAPVLLERAQFRLHLQETGATSRLLTITAAPEAEQRLRHSLAIRAFLQQNGRGAAERRYLQGDASPRFYEKLFYNESDNQHKTEILMDAPLREIADSSRAIYIKQAHLAAHNRQFVAIDRLLCRNGFKAPQIYAENEQQTLLILEDLGRDSLSSASARPNARRYLACSEFLARFHQTDWVKAARQQNCLLPVYDEAALQVEADLLPDWYLPYKTGSQASSAWRAEYHRLWQPLFAGLQQNDQNLVLRDFHSPNILWQNGEEGIRRIGLIDFQDAIWGPEAYDLVSLAQDARLTIAPELEKLIIEAYQTARAAFAAPFNVEKSKEAYAILGAQRAAKILGAFVRLDRRDGKDFYMRHLPRIADYLQRNLQAPLLKPLKDFFAESGLI
ncbi:MAG: tRNA (adenosine(37)-N6)-threonylcarbamoyltransferase complex ATPase subunit type 1 TsaE [Candidatus Tokpelaia sp.]|nr:MAG: tRNA (adenosine(37)-N6)-threonylcarbamoyltransferase complex ATPase subunit type 1 TsaE [Candidatus Tokpelaia sp.]KAA6205995.1 MAG: tRNA (adenosine(37)-N6)-threonylcarbamoyltransferase complex ATPase subunit type 1 TsaE [Candidatus Tokpelaia sp.]